MKGVTKTKGQLIEELATAHQLNAELRNSVSEHKRIENAIKGSEGRYRNLVENAHDVLWVFDLNLGYTYISPSVKRLRGYSVEEAMKQRLDQLLTPESAKKARELFERERLLEVSGHRHGPDWSLTSEFEMIHKNGSPFWVEVTMNPLHDEAGRIKGIMGITRDISERKRAEEDQKKHRDELEGLVKASTAELAEANEQLRKEIQERTQIEEALRESTEKYRIHFSLANDVMFSYDHLYRVLSVSPNVERLLGYKPEELVGRSFQDLKVLHPDSMDEAVENAMHVLSGETIYSSIYEFVTKDGARKFGEVSGVPLIREGQVVGVISVARDVTERIEMANSLQESEERYRITLQSMPDAVSIIRIEDSRYLYVNDAFCKISGYTLDEVKGKTPRDLNLPATPEGLDHCLDLIKNNESIDFTEYRCRKKDGTIIDTLVSARPVHYSGEDCLVMVMADITALKQMEEEKKRLEIQSQKMESIGTLASGIAHDFNNILTSIIGYTQLSMKDILNPAKGDIDISSVRSDLNEVRNAAHRARDLVNHILAFSRHAEKDHIPVNLSSTVKESLKVLRPTLPSNIKVRENLIDPNLILGDPGQIHQVLTNLCTNAAHAMDKTGGEIEVSLQRVIVDDDALNLDVAPGPYLRLSVRDTGPGMTSKVMTRIFDPYFTTKWRGHGTGLGLSIVHGIVKNHGGAISCKTAPGEGTTFDIYLPEYEFGKEDGETKAETTHALGDERILDLDEDLTRKELKGKEKGDLSIHGKNKQY